jgi:eukaryotic-like serine/threonine-protein kinase
MQLTPGTVIADRYRLDRLLGEGGMGSVWAATHLVTRKQVAAKFLRTQYATEDMIRRFFREARAVSAVHHAHVVQVHDMFSTADGDPVMVMDLLHGEPLSARLAREPKIPLEEMATLLLPVASAVGTAHTAGVVHRDLKPDNIFLEKNADGVITPKVLDFGIAKVRKLEEGEITGELTKTGALLGTPHYMAPEQAFGEKDVDHRADIWSFGVIMYECLAGCRPVDGENLGQLFRILMSGNIRRLQAVAPWVPEDVANLVDRMLSVNRDQRPSDMREPFELLRKYTDATASSFSCARQAVMTDSVGPVGELATEPTLNAASTPPTASAGPRRRLALWLGAAVSVLVAIVAVFGGRYMARQVWVVSSVAVAVDLPLEPPDAGAVAASALVPSAAASASAPPVETTGKGPGPKSSTTKAAVVASAVPSVTTVGPPPASAKARLPGGVVGAAPF